MKRHFISTLGPTKESFWWCHLTTRNPAIHGLPEVTTKYYKSFNEWGPKLTLNYSIIWFIVNWKYWLFTICYGTQKMYPSISDSEMSFCPNDEMMMKQHFISTLGSTEESIWWCHRTTRNPAIYRRPKTNTKCCKSFNEYMPKLTLPYVIYWQMADWLFTIFHSTQKMYPSISDSKMSFFVQMIKWWWSSISFQL
jgi:hypothetical protein